MLVYVFHSQVTSDSTGQDWGILNQMFAKVLEELKGGYLTTYAIDCAVEHGETDP